MTSLEVQYSTCGLTCELCDQLLDGLATAVPRLYLSYLARIWHGGTCATEPALRVASGKRTPDLLITSSPVLAVAQERRPVPLRPLGYERARRRLTPSHPYRRRPM
jgi:hypothetical protein